MIHSLIRMGMLARGTSLSGQPLHTRGGNGVRRKAAFASVCLVMGVASGCARAAPASAPAPVDRRAAVRSIALCTSTEADLRAALGPPTRDGMLGRRRILSWIVAEESVVSYLAVLLDSRGVVVDLVWDVPTEIPWTPTDQCRAGAASAG